MAEKSVAEKLLINEGRSVLFVNPPNGYEALLEDLPEQVTVAQQPGEPVETSKTKTDINRDSIVAYAQTLSMEGVAMISIDDNWSALRLKII